MSYVKVQRPVSNKSETKAAPPPTPRVEVRDLEDLVQPSDKKFNFASTGFKVGLVSKRGRRTVRAKRMRQGAKEGSLLPPMIDVTVTIRKTWRFVGQDLSATQRNVSVGSLLQALGSMAISTTQLSTVMSSFKIHKITCYPAASTTLGIVLLEWVDSSGNPHTKDSRMNQSVPGGITIERPVVFRPPAGSDASFWQSGAVSTPGSANLFALSATVGTILDLDVSCTMLNDGTNFQDNTYTGLTVGNVYYPSLDGRATNDWAPVGRTNAT